MSFDKKQRISLKKSKTKNRGKKKCVEKRNEGYYFDRNEFDKINFFHKYSLKIDLIEEI